MTNYKADLSVRNEIEEKLNELLDLCQMHCLPMYSCVAISNSDEETEYTQMTYGAKGHDIELFDDRISKNLLVARGFGVVPKRNALIMPNLEEE